MTPSPIVVIGIGNPYRRDDGVGPAVVRQLAADGVTTAALVESDGEATALIDHWQGRQLAIVVDAAHVAAPVPGRIHRLDWLPAPGSSSASSHGIDLGLAVRLAQELDRLPQRMLVFAVEAAETGYGWGLSPAVAHSADEIVAELRAVIGTGPNAPRPGADRP
jgi:hydrogenase maturation protease